MAGRQPSQGYARHFRSIYWLHIRRFAPDDYWVNVISPARPAPRRLICSFCSSSQNFAYSILPTPPHDGSSCCSARVPSHQGPRGLSPPSEFPVRFRLPVLVTKGLASRPKGTRAMPGTQQKRERRLPLPLLLRSITNNCILPSTIPIGFRLARKIVNYLMTGKTVSPETGV